MKSRLKRSSHLCPALWTRGFDWHPFFSSIVLQRVLWLSPVAATIDTDGCLTYFEHFMLCQSWPRQAERAAISAPAGESLTLENISPLTNGIIYIFSWIIDFQTIIFMRRIPVFEQIIALIPEKPLKASHGRCCRGNTSVKKASAQNN